MATELITGIVIAASTIFAYSVLFGDHILSKTMENVYMGIMSGFIFASQLNYIQDNVLGSIQNGQYVYVLAAILAIMIFSRLKSEWTWLTRYPIAIVVGTGLGLSMRAVIISDFWKQVKASMIPLNSINNIILVLGTITVIYYFVFSTGYYKGSSKSIGQASNYIRKIGMLFLVIMVGATYAKVTGSRYELVVGRMVDLLKPEIRIYTYAFTALAAIIIIMDSKLRSRAE